MSRLTIYAVVFLGVCLGVEDGAHGQTPPVIPTSGNWATVEGDGYTYGLGRYAPMRSQYIYASGVMPGAMTIKSFKLRADGGRQFVGGHSLEVEVWMSNNGKDPAAGLSYHWATNRGADFGLVMNKRKIIFPATTGVAPAPFNIDFPLDTPFAYKGQAFLVEFRTHGTLYDYHDYYLDAVKTTGGIPPQPGIAVAFGLACPPDFAFYTARAGVGTGGLFFNYGYTGISNKAVPVLDILGNSMSNWGPITLPFDLSFLGVPGCMLFTNLLTWQTVFSDPKCPLGHTVSLWGSIPADPILVGVSLYSQWLALDGAYSPGGVAVSAARMLVLGDGSFGGSCAGIHLFTYGKRAGNLYTGNESSARFFAGRALLMELH